MSSKINKINKKSLIYLNHLANIVDKFPAPVNNILKASYMAKCQSNVIQTDDYLTTICPTCNINISETAKFQLIPKKCSNFAKLLKKKLANGSNLTNYQKKYAKHLPVTSDDKQVAFNITCNVCNKSVKKVISKWKEPSKKRAAPEEFDVVKKPPKKRKKKADKTCGLNVEAIQSAQPLGKCHENIEKGPTNEQQRPIIINNANGKKKPRNEATREALRNNKKLGDILGISLTNNSHKETCISNFFESF